MFQKKYSLTSVALVATLVVACSTGVKKSEIAQDAVPAEEVARVEKQIQSGYEQQLDVLSPEEFMKSEKYLEEAREDLASGQKQSEVLSDIGYADSFFQKAQEKSGSRKMEISGIIEARHKAIAAGARDASATRNKISDMDDDLRDEAGAFAKLTPTQVSYFQNGYLQMEADALLDSKVGQARANIEAAKKSGAESYAPKALKLAQIDLANAENLIQANRNNEDTYSSAVEKSRTSAEILAATVVATKDGKVDEATASQMVEKDRALVAQKSVASTNAASVRVQAALESARQEFSSEEADVFQQGDKLLIRLKSMNFPSGRSDLPTSALPILAKVRNVAKTLGPQEVVVEGHTDAVGGKVVNKTLSEERAKSVASYLGNNGIPENVIQASGLGFDKPIASNKSKNGRAQNRRVDVVITPSTGVADKSAGNSSLQ